MPELFLPFENDLVKVLIVDGSVECEETAGLIYYTQLHDDVHEWCRENITGPMKIDLDCSEVPGFIIVFERFEDLVLFKLRWM